MTRVNFISLSHSPPINFYFLTTKYFQIIYSVCSSIVWQSISSFYCRYHSLSLSPPEQNFWQLFFSFRKVYPTSFISSFINFNDRLKAFDNCKKQAKNKKKDEWFLIFKGTYNLKVYSIYYTDHITHRSFTFNLPFLYELKREVFLSKIVCGIFHFLFRFVFI